jgi:hypothetical protein
MFKDTLPRHRAIVSPMLEGTVSHGTPVPPMFKDTSYHHGASFPRKRESILLFASTLRDKSKMDSRFRGNDAS